MKIVLLALDPERAHRAVDRLTEVLGPDTRLHAVTVTPVRVPGVVLSRPPKPYSPDESLRALDRARRTGAIALANLRNLRALRRDRAALTLLAGADLVVVGDDVSVRAGRDVARALGRRVWGRITTVPYALATLDPPPQPAA